MVVPKFGELYFMSHCLSKREEPKSLGTSGELHKGDDDERHFVGCFPLG